MTAVDTDAESLVSPTKPRAGRRGFRARHESLPYINHDPLLASIEWFRPSPARVFVTIQLAAVVLLVPAGLLISGTHLLVDEPTKAFWDAQEWPLDVIIYGLMLPLIWVTYIWQPRQILAAVHRLQDDRLLVEPGETVDPEREIGYSHAGRATERELTAALYGRRVAVAACIITFLCAGFWLYQFVAEPFGSDPYQLVNQTPWFSAWRPYFLLWWLCVTCTSIYTITCILIRQGIATRALHEAFTRLRVAPRIKHPDRVSGFGPFNDLMRGVALVETLFGLWIAVVIGYPALFGDGADVKPDVLLLIALYLAILPMVAWPVWSAHRALAAEKHRRLESISVQLRTRYWTPTAIRAWPHERVVHLNEQYALIEAGIAVWPVRLPVLRGVVASTIATWIGIAISVSALVH